MGHQRTDLERLKKIIPDPYGQAAGLVPVVSTYVDERGLTQYLYTLQTVAPGSAQTKIQFQYNGGNLGAAGTVDTVNVVSSWVNFARSTNTVTLTIPTPSGGTTGLTFTAALGSLTLGGTLAIANGGTGQTTAPLAINALLPAQSGHGGEFLTTNGTIASWGAAGSTYTPPVTTKGDLFGYSTVPTRIPVGSDGQSPIADSTQTTGLRYADAFRGPGCIFSNGSLVLSGTLTDEIQVPYGGTITGWTIVGDVSGSASIIVSHSTYSAYDTMTTLFTATVTTAKKNQTTGLGNAIAKGDILRFSGSGFSGFTRCSIVLSVTP